jgi:hypothetical protein
MRVGVLPTDDSGCGHYRLRFPVRALRSQGADVRILTGFDGEYVGNRLQRVLDPGVDVVVLQRPLKPDLAEVIPHLQRRGVAVVVELDDDFRTVPMANPAFWTTHPKAAPHQSRETMYRCMRLADLVTVSTPALVTRFGGPEKACLLRNLVPARYLTIRRRVQPYEIRPPVVGWPGSPTTHPGDLEVTRGAVARAVNRTTARFRAIGGETTCEVLGIPPDRGEHVPWTKTIHEYPGVVAELDVGIVPLADTAFNTGKSCLKGLEMSSLGVPFVASPLPEYVWLAQRGAGDLARSKSQWESALVRLIQDPSYRSERAEAGRTAASRLTYEEHCGAWMDAWQEAFDRRMRTSANAARRATL